MKYDNFYLRSVSHSISERLQTRETQWCDLKNPNDCPPWAFEFWRDLTSQETLGGFGGACEPQVPGAASCMHPALNSWWLNFHEISLTIFL